MNWKRMGIYAVVLGAAIAGEKIGSAHYNRLQQLNEMQGEIYRLQGNEARLKSKMQQYSVRSGNKELRLDFDGDVGVVAFGIDGRKKLTMKQEEFWKLYTRQDCSK